MTPYQFEIFTDGVATVETVEAADDDSATRQALLFFSEIVRDRALSKGGALVVRLTVSDLAGRTVWSGSATSR